MGVTAGVLTAVPQSLKPWREDLVAGPVLRHTPSPQIMKLRVKHGARETEVEVDPDDSVGQMALQIEENTGILARTQKLLFKGKVLAPDRTVRDSKLTPGSSVLLIASGAGQTQVPSCVCCDCLQRTRQSR